MSKTTEHVCPCGEKFIGVNAVYCLKCMAERGREVIDEAVRVRYEKYQQNRIMKLKKRDRHYRERSEP